MGDTAGHPFRGNQFHSAGEHGSGGDAAEGRKRWLAGSAEEERRVEGMSPKRYRMHLEKKITRLGRAERRDEMKRVLEKLQAWSAAHPEFREDDYAKNPARSVR